MTRTASHNSALSLGSCISAAVTVLSIRTVAPVSSLSCLALANAGGSDDPRARAREHLIPEINSAWMPEYAETLLELLDAG
jgi:hypothetical protein